MNWRTTGILAGVLLLLLGAVYWQTNRVPVADPVPTPFAAPAPTELVVGVTTMDVRSLQIEDLGSGEMRVFEQGNAGIWAQSIPTPTLLITQTMQAQIGGLTRFTSRRTLDPDTNPLSAYGLDTPQLQFTLTVGAEGATTAHQFIVGNQTATGDGYYIQKVGDNQVYIVITTNIQNMFDLLANPPFAVIPIFE